METKKVPKSNTVESKFEEILKELRRIRVGSKIGWQFGVGLAAVIFASTLIPIEPNPIAAGIIFTLGVLAMILPPYIKK